MTDDDQRSLVQWQPGPLTTLRNKLVRRGIQTSEAVLAVSRDRNLSHFDSPTLQLSGHFADHRLIDEGFICNYGYGYVRQVYPVDDQYVVVLTLATAGLYHWVTGECKWVIDCLNWDAKLSPRHTYLAMSNHFNSGTALWDLRSGRQMVIHSDYAVRGLGFNRSETRLAIAAGKEVLIYDLDHKCEQGRLQTGSGSSRGVCFSPDGRILAASTSAGDVQLWDAEHLSLLGKVATLGPGIPDIVFSDDGEFLAGGDANSFYAWRVQSDGRSLIPWIVESYGKVVSSEPSNVVISPDNKCLLTWEDDLPFRMWDLDSRKPIQLPTDAPALNLATISYMQGGQLFVAGTDGAKAYLWNSTTGRLEYRLELSGHHRSVTALQMTSDERYLISGDENGSILCWDLAQNGNSRQLWDTANEIAAMQLISDQGPLVAVSRSGDVDVVDTVSGRQVCHGQLDTGIGPNTRYEISADGRTLAVLPHDGGRVLVYSLPDCELQWNIKLNNDDPRYSLMSLSKNGLMLAVTLGDKHQYVNVYDLKAKSASLMSIGFHVYGLELTSDGNEVHVATKNSIVAYELKQGQKRWEYGHDLWDYCTPPALSTLSADGSLFARKGNQDAILVYDLRSQKLVRVIAGHFAVCVLSGGCHAVSLGSRRRVIAIGSLAGVVQLFKLDGSLARVRANSHDMFMAIARNSENVRPTILAAIAADPNGDIAQLLTPEEVEEIKALLQDDQSS